MDDDLFQVLQWDKSDPNTPTLSLQGIKMTPQHSARIIEEISSSMSGLSIDLNQSANDILRSRSRLSLPQQSPSASPQSSGKGRKRDEAKDARTSSPGRKENKLPANPPSDSSLMRDIFSKDLDLSAMGEIDFSGGLESPPSILNSYQESLRNNKPAPTGTSVPAPKGFDMPPIVLEEESAEVGHNTGLQSHDPFKVPDPNRFLDFKPPSSSGSPAVPGNFSVPTVSAPRAGYQQQRQQQPTQQQQRQHRHQHQQLQSQERQRYQGGFDHHQEVKSGFIPAPAPRSNMSMPNPAFQQQQVQAQIRSQIGSRVAPPGYTLRVHYFENTKYIGPTTLNRPHYKSKQTWEWDVYPHGVSRQNGKIRLQIKQKGGNPTYPTFPNTLEGVLAAAMFRDKQALKLWKEGKLVRMPKINFDHPKEMLQKPKANSAVPKHHPSSTTAAPVGPPQNITTATTPAPAPHTSTAHASTPNPAPFLNLNGNTAVPPPAVTAATHSSDPFGHPEPLDLSSMPNIDFA